MPCSLHAVQTHTQVLHATTCIPFAPRNHVHSLCSLHAVQTHTQVLHATTCIPFVSVPCTYISGIGRGLYYDGVCRRTSVL